MKNKNIFIYISLIFCYAVLITGSTYAYLNISASKNNITAQAGCFEVNYSGDTIIHKNLSATTNYLEGARGNITVSKANNCDLYTEAYIYMYVNDNITAPIETVQALKYKVVQGSTDIDEGYITSKGETLLTTVPLTTTSTTYTVYIWVDSSLSNKQYDEVKFNGYIYAESDQTSTIENNYTVTFNPNGGSVSTTSKTVSFRKPYGSLPIPTRSGYTFKGWSVLPSGYQELEYIEASGTQHINTNYTITSDNVMFEGALYMTKQSSEKDIIGVIGNQSIAIGTGWNSYNFFAYSTNGGASTGIKTSTTADSIMFNKKVSYIVKYNSTTPTKEILINNDNSLYYTNSTANADFKNKEIQVFASNNNYKFYGKLYSLKIYDNNNLVRDFIPCYNTSTNKAGLYDLKNGSFYENNGSGNFTNGGYIYTTSSTLVSQSKNHTLYAIWG